ncbi:unnamed protein product [Cuscuta campestris]|uniref:Uncharacterized protein n=1 Tax=Cuscuta campestris TaxID=132261 RepID=A0A484MSB6_9ASTE|nr:unnamed protein product [Cuscuta campestris]
MDGGSIHAPWKHTTCQKKIKKIAESEDGSTSGTSDINSSFVGICLVVSISLLSFLVFSEWLRGFENPHAFVRTGTTTTTSDSIRCGGGEDDDRTPPATNISHVLFGIGSSLETWNSRRHYCDVWWDPNVMRGFVWLDRRPPENKTWPERSPPFRVSQDTTGFKYTCSYGSRSAVRIARIVKESFELGAENVRWFVMGDDDTVFFPENLVAVLSKYDHREMYYIGGVSESVEQAEEHSYTMAYGGGGFAISYPLAAKLVRVLDGCIDRYAEYYGSDRKIGACIAEIGVPLTKEPGFHQMDIRDDPYGLLAAHSVAPLVSLHHLGHMWPMFPEKSQEESLRKLVSAYKADPSRTLQQSFCYDTRRNWTISVAWGYTVQLYPALVRAKELEMPYGTFLTWNTWQERPFTFDVRRMSSDLCEKPLIFYLDDKVGSFGSRGSVTTYNRAREEDGKECDSEEYKPALSVSAFNVSAQVLSPDIWKKAPRRQCCEVVNDRNGIDHILQLKLRGCNRWESSVTPP